jgi:molecular chaperone DnaK
VSLAIGIDLGTTNSVAAFKFAALEVVNATDNLPPERVLTPSAVAYTPTGSRVGQEALAQLVAAPERVVVSVKRIMGRGHGEPAVQDYTKRFGHLDLEAPEAGTDQGIAIRVGDQRIAPEDVSAAILRKVVANAKTYMGAIGRPGAHIGRAVVTVPAYFNDKQRHATRVAGARAGFEVVELLPEPTAAAISYALDAGQAETILVYDFGGGTFDASLITAAGNTFVETAKAGDMWLGGNDVDLALEAHVLEVVAREEGVADVAGLVARLPDGHRRRFAADLRQAVEQAKIALSAAERTMVIPATPLPDADGAPLMIEVPLSRAELEARIAPLVERTVAICRRMLEEAGFPLEAVDRVLLVGGSSQVPLVQRTVREAFGDRVVVHPRPMTAVAEGAAIVAAGLVDKVGTVSRDYYLRLADDPRHCVIARNEVLPCRTSHTFVTVTDGQRLLRLRFFNHDHVAGVDEPIGDIWLGLDRAYPKGTEIMVFFELDEACNVLQVTASLKQSPEVRVSRTFSRGQADEAVYEELEDLIGRLGEGEFTRHGIETGLQRAVDVVRHANQVLDPHTDAVRPEALQASLQSLGKLRTFVSRAVMDAELALAALRDVMTHAAEFLSDEDAAAIEDLIARLTVALREPDEVTLRPLTEEARRRLRVLPPEAQAVLHSVQLVDQIRRDHPAEAPACAAKQSRLVDALRGGRSDDAAQLLRELERASEEAGWQAERADGSSAIVLEPGRTRS